MFERWGLHLSRSTLCGWVESCADKLAILVEAMAKDALNAHCIAIDATGVLVQAKDKCRRGHFWVLVADREHVLFRFTPHHNQDGPKEFLRGYKGYVQADASNVYEQLFRTEQVTEVGCWAHCRRKFFEAMTSDRDRATVAHRLHSQALRDRQGDQGAASEPSNRAAPDGCRARARGLPRLA